MIFVVVLLLISILGLHNVYQPLSDSCYYGYRDKCGDKCIDSLDSCKCGDEKFIIGSSSNYCCVLQSEECSVYGNCPTGVAKSI